MEPARDVEFVFEPQVEGGYHAYAPELPGLHTQGDSLEDAAANAEEALALYVRGSARMADPYRWGSFGAGCRCQLDRAAAGRLRRTTRRGPWQARVECRRWTVRSRGAPSSR